MAVQGVLVNAIFNDINPSIRPISNWTKAIENLHSNVFCFLRKALQQQLPTAANLVRWGKAASDTCRLCTQRQTNKHVLSNCSSLIALERYKVRHDAVLIIIYNWLRSTLAAPAQIHVDLALSHDRPITDVFTGLRPDIAIVNSGKITILELTVCHETNFQKSKEYKATKYKNLKKNLVSDYKDYKIEICTIEVSTLGFISEMPKEIVKLVGNLPYKNYSDIIKSVVSNSYKIYLKRNDY